MKRFSLGACLCACSLTLVCMVGLVGCESSDSNNNGDTSELVATKVNDIEITEGDITDKIEAFRIQRGYSDDRAWAEYLQDNGLTAEEVRESYMDELITRDIVEQECADRGIEITSQKIDDFVKSMREYYGYPDDDEAWAQFLADQGMTEEEYRDNYKSTELTNSLRDALAAEAEAEDGEELDSNAKNEIYIEWLTNATNSAEIVKVEMPSGLPYDVDIEALLSEDNAEQENTEE